MRVVCAQGVRCYLSCVFELCVGLCFVICGEIEMGAESCLLVVLGVIIITTPYASFVYGTPLAQRYCELLTYEFT